MYHVRPAVIGIAINSQSVVSFLTPCDAEWFVSLVYSMEAVIDDAISSFKC